MYNDDRIQLGMTWLGMDNGYNPGNFMKLWSNENKQSLIVPIDNVYGFRFIERPGWHVVTKKDIDDSINGST